MFWSGVGDVGDAELLDDLSPWARLPEDEGRWAPPAEDAVLLDDLSPWDVLEEDRVLGGPSSEEWPPAGERSAGEPPERARPPWRSWAGVEDVPPDGMLALVLEQVDVEAVDERMLVETVAGWERLAAWAHLNAALAAAELSRRASMNPTWAAPAPADRSVAGDELAMRLGWSRRAAARLVRDGRALENELLLTADAVRDGRLDTARLRVMADRLHDRPAELAWAVQEAVLPDAGTRTPTQLAADVDRTLLAVDPKDAADRLARATANRHVCRPRRLPDGMAGVWAVLPADDAVLVDATLESTARAARALGDPRTLDQLRADVFVDLASGRALAAGAIRPEGRAPGVPDGSGAAALAGSGASDPADDVGTVDDVGTIDDVGTVGPCGDEDQADPRTEGRAAARDSADGDRRTGPPPVSPPIRIPQVRIDVTVPLSTLMGLDDAPAELAGFGPISAEQARALAAGGVWRRLVTDPLSGAVLDVGRRRYRPPRPLAEHVVARDAVCAAPGCSVPASRCDLDHTTEYRGRPRNGATAPGTTSAGNLGPLSDRCHRIKTDGGFALTQPEPGVFEWRTPAGLAYRVIPGAHGRTERLRADPTAPPGPGYPDEPPF